MRTAYIAAALLLASTPGAAAFEISTCEPAWRRVCEPSLPEGPIVDPDQPLPGPTGIPSLDDLAPPDAPELPGEPPVPLPVLPSPHVPSVPAPPNVPNVPAPPEDAAGAVCAFMPSQLPLGAGNVPPFDNFEPDRACD